MPPIRLTAFWITWPHRYAPIGFGVTAWSAEDALRILRALGWGDYLPDDGDLLQVREGITFAELDQRHIVPNMGPINLRGGWYPGCDIGVPGWAQERIRGRGP